MSKIVAGVYELLQEIGSGGGGIVYLGRHLRLNKLVVLKADKRTLATRPESLRREVDTLKNLSHTYIPQVYDFLAEDGVVYTVMDYIEGESLDKPLRRGERFSQATVVEWACQLLEALVYLHSIPPHGILHSDIKPANIMLTPQGNICLIDFNIALALGEDGAVNVGFSQGYASPEHYGVDYTGTSNSQRTGGSRSASRQSVRSLQDAETVLDNPPVIPKPSVSRTGRKIVKLDVHSDIYSAGATLYHLFTGHRPAVDAKSVEPIPAEEVSPAIADILSKAMHPDPECRYQSAAEMLSAFEHLHSNDRRTRRHKRRIAVAAAALSVLFLAGAGLTFVGLKQMERLQNAYVLAEYSANALNSGDVEGAIAYALAALPEERGIFDPTYTAQAQYALADALGVYDLTDGYAAHSVETFDSEPLQIALSPDGTHLAVMTLGMLYLLETESGTVAAQLAAEPSALSEMVFQDNDTLFYAAEGGLCAYSLTQGELWRGARATSMTLSADGTTVAAVYKDDTCAYIYAADSGKLLQTVDFEGRSQDVVVNDVFANPEDNLFILSGEGEWLAVSFSDGGLWVYNLWDHEEDIEIYDVSDYTHFEGGFCGTQLAFVSTGINDSIFAVVDVEALEYMGMFRDSYPFHTYTDEGGVYVLQQNLIVKLNPETAEQTEVAYTENEITAFVVGDTYTLVADEAGTCYFFDRAAGLMETHQSSGDCGFMDLAGDFAVTASVNSPTVGILKLESHAECQIASYDISYDHDEARLSADRQTVVLFSYDAFRVCTLMGDVIADVSIPDAEQVYDQQFVRDEGGSFLEVTYNNGTVLRYSAATGELAGSYAVEVPDGSLYEEFYTDKLKITSPLHGTPAAYDIESGRLVRELESDDYLTYVTQVGDCVVTEYITAQGERYGLLLDENCETLAKMPNLCDVFADGTLIFDDTRGNLRQSRIYSIQELLTLANTKN